jgi:competence protein ComEA
MGLSNYFRKPVKPEVPESSPAGRNGVSNSPQKPLSIPPRNALHRTDPTPATPPSMDQAVELFNSIQEIIGPEADVVRIPADQVLKNIPNDLKGPEWSDEALAHQSVELDREPLLAQLKKGRVSYPASDIAACLPPGWIRPQADTLIELPLPAVVAAVPSGDLRGSDRVDDEVLAASSMRDYFQKPVPESVPLNIPAETEPALSAAWTSDITPAGNGPTTEQPAAGQPQPSAPVSPPAVPIEAPVADIAATAPVPVLPPEETIAPRGPDAVVAVGPDIEPPPRSVPEMPSLRRVVAADLTPKTGPEDEVSGWDGVERQMDAGANAIDLNTSDASILESLPGVGAFRAQLILEYRKLNGPFAGVYDLLRIQGIGRRLFRQITGLRPLRKNRRDRHEVLNDLLGIPTDQRPSLGQIMQRASDALEATGSILSGPDGILLSQVGMDAQSADRYAAFTPNFFRKTRRYWPILGVDGVQQVLLPGARPQALLLNGNKFAWILLVPEGKDWNRLIEQSAAIAEEINWLFSPHAVVRRIEADPAGAQGPAP